MDERRQEKAQESPPLPELVTSDHFITLTKNQYEKLLMGQGQQQLQGHGLLVKEKGTVGTFPPLPSKAGKRFYVPGRALLKKGTVNGVYCGAHALASTFSGGYSWKDTKPGDVYGFYGLEEAVAFWYGRYEKEAGSTVQVIM